MRLCLWLLYSLTHRCANISFCVANSGAQRGANHSPTRGSEHVAQYFADNPFTFCITNRVAYSRWCNAVTKCLAVSSAESVADGRSNRYAEYVTDTVAQRITDAPWRDGVAQRIAERHAVHGTDAAADSVADRAGTFVAARGAACGSPVLRLRAG